MIVNEEEFRLEIGRLRDRGARPRTFVGQVLEATARAGGRLGQTPQRRFRASGRVAAASARLRHPGRRVLVKARVVRRAGRAFRSAPLATHIAYLKRDGLDRAGGRAEMFDRQGVADGAAFARRCDDDRHHFRFIISPEDAAELQDLRAFGRDLMRQVELDLGTRLDWVAVDHWDTAHPHLHVLVRGRDAQGADLVIAGDYIARGLRNRAEALVSLELGPRTAREIAAALGRETSAERWTGIDNLIDAQSAGGRLDLRRGGPSDNETRLLMVARLKVLVRLGLAGVEEPGLWRLEPDRRERLRELGRRGDIISTLHRTAGRERALSDLRPFGEAAPEPIVGQVLARGLQDELTGQAYIVVDGLDGRVHHIGCPDLAATGDTPRGGLVEIVPGEGPGKVRHRSDLSLRAQVTADGATWLDRQLVAREPAPRVRAGFGAEVERALAARAAHLETQALGRVASGRWTAAPDLLATLRGRELARAGGRLAAETGFRFEPKATEGAVTGVYRRRLDLASGRFAMIERDGAFRLLPWSRRLDRELGKSVEATLEGGMLRLAAGRARGREL